MRRRRKNYNDNNNDFAECCWCYHSLCFGTRLRWLIVRRNQGKQSVLCWLNEFTYTREVAEKSFSSGKWMSNAVCWFDSPPRLYFGHSNAYARRLLVAKMLCLRDQWLSLWWYTAGKTVIFMLEGTHEILIWFVGMGFFALPITVYVFGYLTHFSTMFSIQFLFVF